jgi:hypothetical protein
MAHAHGSAAAGQTGSTETETAALAALRSEFPHFRIWREVTGTRLRYIARRLDQSAGLHTVVTDNLHEMGEALSSQAPPQQSPAPAQAPAPNVARMYSYWLGGKDHFATDRHAANQVLAGFPEVTQIARANRQLVLRAVAHTASQGITQFLDLGAGLPTWPTVHEVAAQASPAARTCYVDCDEVVLTHARALLAASHGSSPIATVVPGDVRDPAAILAHPALQVVIDLDRPLCVILAAVLHFLEPAEADTAVAALTAALAPGSYLVISAGTSTGTDPALLQCLHNAYTGTTISARTEQDIAAWFAGLHLLPPGLVDVRHWRPGHTTGRPPAQPAAARFLAAVGYKSPSPSPDQQADKQAHAVTRCQP